MLAVIFYINFSSMWGYLHQFLWRKNPKILQKLSWEKFHPLLIVSCPSHIFFKYFFFFCSLLDIILSISLFVTIIQTLVESDFCHIRRYVHYRLASFSSKAQPKASRLQSNENLGISSKVTFSWQNVPFFLG